MSDTLQTDTPQSIEDQPRRPSRTPRENFYRGTARVKPPEREPPAKEPSRREEPPTREELLRAKLTMLINRALNSMIEAGHIEPGMMTLIANARATIAALDARKQPKDE